MGPQNLDKQYLYKELGSRKPENHFVKRGPFEMSKWLGLQGKERTVVNWIRGIL